jgi:DnaJ-class molecular chaperone
VNPYEVLGVSKTATQDEIKAAYRKLAKKYHPDFNPGNKASETKFKEINEAFQLIGTVEGRKKYDEGPPTNWQQFARGEGAHQGPFYYSTQGPGSRYTHQFSEGIDDDLFDRLFRQSRSSHGPRSHAGFRGGSDFGEVPFGMPQEETYSMEIELRDAVLGAEREITLPTGRKLRVKIPAGVKDGTKLRFAAKDENQSDVFVELKVRPNEKFRRSGDDIETELPISLPEAILGGEVEVPTLDGQVLLKIPKGVNNGTKLRVKGKGVPNRGDQYVTLRVVLPKTVDAQLEEAIRTWSQSHHYDPRGET